MYCCFLSVTAWEWWHVVITVLKAQLMSFHIKSNSCQGLLYYHVMFLNSQLASVKKTMQMNSAHRHKSTCICPLHYLNCSISLCVCPWTYFHIHRSPIDTKFSVRVAEVVAWSSFAGAVIGYVLLVLRMTSLFSAVGPMESSCYCCSVDRRLTQCRIKVGAIDAAALGPFKK